MKWKVLLFGLLLVAAALQSFSSGGDAVTACTRIAGFAAVSALLYWLKLPAASIIFLAVAPLASSSYLFGGIGAEAQGKLLVVSIAAAAFLYFTAGRQKHFPQGMRVALLVGATCAVALLVANAINPLTITPLPIFVLMCLIPVEMIARRVLRAALAASPGLHRPYDRDA